MQIPAPPARDLDSVEAAIEAIGRGEFVVVIDNEDRENEGDLIMAASAMTPAAMAFMVRHTSGVVCVSMPGSALDRLDIPLMVATNTESFSTAFTISVDACAGTTTGISATDRAITIRKLAEPTSAPLDFARPGHVFPLRSRAGGVLERPGHTEAAQDLVHLAGRGIGGVLCEIVNDDGSMARRGDLIRFAAKHRLTMISIAQLVAFRQATVARTGAQTSVLAL